MQVNYHFQYHSAISDFRVLGLIGKINTLRCVFKLAEIDFDFIELDNFIKGLGEDKSRLTSVEEYVKCYQLMDKIKMLHGCI